MKKKPPRYIPQDKIEAATRQGRVYEVTLRNGDSAWTPGRRIFGPIKLRYRQAHNGWVIESL